MRVTLFDYGAGNLHSLAKAIEGEGTVLRIETDPRAAVTTDVLVLPGVGAFAPAAAALAPGREAMRAAIAGGLPCIGICLGLQLLFDASEEGEGAGLGVIAGRVRRLRSERQPHMGWNTLDTGREPLLVSSGLTTAYFAHSFVCEPNDTSVVKAWTTHENDCFASVIRKGAALGVQFHPEKSSREGVAFLRAALASVRTARGGAR